MVHVFVPVYAIKVSVHQDLEWMQYVYKCGSDSRKETLYLISVWLEMSCAGTCFVLHECRSMDASNQGDTLGGGQQVSARKMEMEVQVEWSDMATPVCQLRAKKLMSTCTSLGAIRNSTK